MKFDLSQTQSIWLRSKSHMVCIWSLVFFLYGFVWLFGHFSPRFCIFVGISELVCTCFFGEELKLWSQFMKTFFLIECRKRYCGKPSLLLNCMPRWIWEQFRQMEGSGESERTEVRKALLNTYNLCIIERFFQKSLIFKTLRSWKLVIFRLCVYGYLQSGPHCIKFDTSQIQPIGPGTEIQMVCVGSFIKKIRQIYFL